MSLTVRRTLKPGDLGAITAAHGRLYAREHALDATFEASVAAGLAQAIDRGFPRGRDGVWIAERDGAFAGSVAVTDEGGGEGRVRWFLLDPALRGAGVGRRLLGELLAHAADAGFQRLSLVTFADLSAAAHLYRDHGFAVVHAAPQRRWGRERILIQRYELALR